MYDAGKYTVEEIAETFNVGRATPYKHLNAHHDGRDCVLVVYRNTRPGKVDADTNRRYGETGQSAKVQLEADRKWFPIGELRRPRVKGIVYVVNGVVTRVRGIDPSIPCDDWDEDDRGYVDVPVTKPLSDVEIAQRFPTLPVQIGEERSRVRGKIREYLPL